MAINRNYTVKYKRKRMGKTDYLLRRRLIDSNELRVVVRRMLNNVIVQFVKYAPKGDCIVAFADSNELKCDYGWKGHGGNLSVAYLVGYLCGLKSGVKNAVLDIGLARAVKGSCYFAVVKGLIDAGVDVPCSADVIPSVERLTGKHIESYAHSLKGDSYKKQFNRIIAKGLKPEQISKQFEDVKNVIELKWKKK